MKISERQRSKLEKMTAHIHARNCTSYLIAAALLIVPCFAQSAASNLASPLPAPLGVANLRNTHVTSSSSKVDLVKKFRSLADKQTQELNGIDDRIRKYLKESTDIALTTQDLKGAERKFKVLSDTLTLLNQARKERLERQDIFSRLALQVDSQWNGQPLQSFMSGQCLDMAELELSSDKGSSQAGVYLVYLSVAIREIAEANEDIVNFIEDFTNYASVLTPKSPVDFISSRSYTAGSISYTAKTIDPKTVADLVSKKLDALPGAAKKSAHNSQVLELRLKPPIPGISATPAPALTN